MFLMSIILSNKLEKLREVLSKNIKLCWDKSSFWFLIKCI